MRRSDLCNYRNVYLVVKGATTVEGTNVHNRTDNMLIFKNNAPFRSFISRNNNLYINNAEDFDTVILMYKLLEYSEKYSRTSGSLWNFHRDEAKDDVNEKSIANYSINNNKATTSRSSEYKTKIIGSTPDDNNLSDTEVVVPVKYLSNF